VLCHVEHRVKIGANNDIPVALSHLLESSVASYTRVVNENIDWSHFLNNPADAFLTRIEIRDINWVGAEFATVRFLHGEPFLHLFVAGRMRYRNPVSGCMHFSTY
jgi:hypothetical protein